MFSASLSANKGVDNVEWRTYAAAMERGQSVIELKLDVEQAIELDDFVGAFTALGAEYDRFMRQVHPDVKADASLYVKQVEKGSIIAHLVPWIPVMVMTASHMEQALIMEDFVRRWGGRLTSYLRPGGRVEDATKGELSDMIDQVAAIANNPGSNLQLAVVKLKNGEKTATASFKFDTSESRAIRDRALEHKREIDHQSHTPHSRVLMVFTRSDVKTVPIGKKSGELVEVEQIEPGRSLPLIYASDLAEERIKHEIREAEDNVYKKGFIVDVDVTTRRGRSVGYSVLNFHQVIDLPDDD